MRIAVYNVENLFDRAKAMNLPGWDDGRLVLERFATLNQLLHKDIYSANDKAQMVQLMFDLDLEEDDRGEFVILRRNRGALLRRPRTGGLEIVAKGRADWVGSLELIEQPINAVSIRNTARVMTELDADILGVVEAESRPALMEFCDTVLRQQGGPDYAHIMLIDGNDSRGIDVGIMTKRDFQIGEMRSHVDDFANGERIFSRDCPEFEITLPGGDSILVLVNHFKSKGYGLPAASTARRRLQAARVAEIYQQRRNEGYGYIAIMGDLNDFPASAALEPLLKDTDLQDISEHPGFDNSGHIGTYGLCNPNDKIDYLLLSPELFASVARGGVVRLGMWPGSQPVRWDVFDSVERPIDAASDHAALWVDVDL